MLNVSVNIDYEILKRNFLIFFSLMFLSLQSSAMSIFFSGEKSQITLMSPMSGVITFNGVPVNNANIEQWIKWNTPEGEVETFFTDENGRFSLPGKQANYRDHPLAQLVVTQELTVKYKGEKILIWSLSRMDAEEDSEFESKLTQVSCELTGELEMHRFENTSLATLCKW